MTINKGKIHFILMVGWMHPLQQGTNSVKIEEKNMKSPM